MNKPSGVYRSVALYSGLTLFCVIQVFLIWRYESEQRSHLPVPDEAKAAAILLAGKLSGPGYFKFNSESKEVTFPYLTKISAENQIGEIAISRKLDPVETGNLQKLIGDLVEPSSSRVAGQEWINGLRLNLALDELKPRA